MGTDISIVKTKILNLIKDEKYDVSDLTSILDSISEYLNNPDFINNINKIVTILTTDRDGSTTFTIDDIKLLAKDPVALMSLVTIIVSTVCAIPALKIKYAEGLSELLVFELLAYIFLVVLPKEAKINWSYDDKVQIVNIALIIVDQIKNSDTIKQIFNEVTTWFKNNVKCNCTCAQAPQPTNKEILNSKLAHHQLIIRHAIESNRETIRLRREIKQLKKFVEKTTYSKSTSKSTSKPTSKSTYKKSKN